MGKRPLPWRSAKDPGRVERLLHPGETVVSQPGEPHTVGPAGEAAVEMVVEFGPALGFEAFVERTFALDRAGHLNAKGHGNPLRLATARPHEAEFSLPRVPVGLQRALLRALAWLGRPLSADDSRLPRSARASPEVGLILADECAPARSPRRMTTASTSGRMLS